MKKKLLYAITIFTMFIGIENVAAAASVTASSQIYPGTFKTTIKVSNASMWEVHMSSSGPVKNCSYDDVNYTSDGNNGSKTYTVTCTATGTGTISLKLTGKTITSNGSQSNISDSATVRVVDRPQATPKSSVNTLDNLWVEGATLDPSFNKDTTEYSVELESDVTSIKIGATKSDGKSSISGDGEKSVSEGMNQFEVKVTAENGSTRTYVIKATVKEKEPIKVNIGSNEYTVVRKREDLKETSELYSETTVTINDEEIPAYYGEITKFTLIGLKDKDGNIENYIYDENAKTYTLYNEISSQKITIYPKMPENVNIPSGYKKEEIEMNEIKVIAYKSEKTKHYLVYGMNVETGEDNFYSYDEEEGTFQRYAEVEENLISEKHIKIIFIAFASVVAILMSIIISLLNKIKRN